MVKVAVILVELTTVTVLPAVKFVPVMVTGIATPRGPEAGEIPVMVGPWTVKVTLLVVPSGVTTATFRADVVAVAVIAQFAVTWVAVVVPVMVQVTPGRRQ